jgi:hypothetical protein
MGPRSRGRLCPRFCHSLPKQREQGMPDARCTRGLVCNMMHSGAHEHTGEAEAIRHSLRDGFTAYTRSPRRRIPFCHRHQRIEDLSAPGRADASPLAWHQQRMPEPHDFTVRGTLTAFSTGNRPAEATGRTLKRRSSARRWATHGKTRPATTIAPDAAASIASNPASVTIAIRPSCWGGRADSYD